eukprot:TRINITY_DN7171_c0_g1_i1.p1 TRINITY_DN7171_c0_g1~~TRINITY_DN7171_c0_g1_i1.p1  ORF type:complete len:263 (+),score=50.33 TRINITY_DN7171_c0_g1_i1:76-789(+)
MGRVVVDGTEVELPKTVAQCSMFRQWAKCVNDGQRMRVKGVELTSLDYPSVAKDNRQFIAEMPPSFVGLRVDAKCSVSDRKLYPLVFLRGCSYTLIPIVTVKETGTRYVVMTVSPCIPAAHMSYTQLPVGSFDPNGEFVGSDAQELKKAGFLELHQKHLSPVASVTSAPSSTDESVELFTANREVKQSWVDAAEVKYSKGERNGALTSLVVVELQHAWRRTTDARTLAALARVDSMH